MESIDIKELNERIKNESSFVDLISMEMNKSSSVRNILSSACS